MIPAISAAVIPQAVITIAMSQIPAYSKLSYFPKAANHSDVSQLLEQIFCTTPDLQS